MQNCLIQKRGIGRFLFLIYIKVDLFEKLNVFVILLRTFWAQKYTYKIEIRRFS